MDDDGGAAFPSEQGECQNGEWNQTYDPGMSLRDYFAGQAIAGIPMGSIEKMGKTAYLIADAMLEARGVL